MKQFLYKISILGALAATAASCGDFLDTVPDNRTEIDTTEKLGKLVTSSYPRAAYAANFNARVDYVTDKGLGFQQNLSNTDPFFWRDVASTAQDSPSYFWSACYTAIAHANEAIAASERIGTPEAIAYGGEARISRAFTHFLLVTTFAQFYQPDTNNDSPGIPFVTEPEDVVIKQYDRETVAKTYARIEEDLIEGLKNLGTDAKYSVPRYHFNRAATHAFATRFYLFKGDFAKAVEYASQVIPVPTKFVTNDDSRNVALTDAANVYALNNFQPWNTDYVAASGNEIKMHYSKAENKSNLLLCEMVTSLGNYGGTWRYSMTREDVTATYRGPHPVMTDPTKESAYKLFSSSVHWYVPIFRAIFSKSSINANSGFYYVVYPLLRNEEVLLSRAEAYVHLNELDKAVADMNIFTRQRIKAYDEKKHCLTLANILKVYKTQISDADHFMTKYNAYGTSSWSDERKALLIFILDSRRNEYQFEGLRYWDMWRYKMPITHSTYDGQTNTLLPGDDRWVLQLPEEAALSGVAQNPRTTLLSPQW